ncbi:MULTISPECIES: glycosyltransferase [Bifidobacterium]|jgi:GT2 family glycosyltransferase|uniref:glycosyltransferase n=1 Tax=Bifidobacterium TaxID=1678 RepID=UPI0023526DA7|nr:glycosyltransferase [Bifidobacterium tibiigranuli]MCH3975802.1 glycosyltransferase [Bifidobacterium tibiigranuli]MCH4189278.1 glycosyltransferase [Bifidobacterium tibiigranuli]MCH4203087.1 glycosyltransferase [Bifidobacterium tibiigranuli]MCH4274764.1 glycosyltransferase [Bifidobacterium tibiigranuli]MCI1211640.1 glycosyltransferase [Bifidobacterium tibiigranuli]
MSLTVTAIVVSYNRAGLLQECLDALAAQTRQPDRVIVIDNASTDGAADVAEQHPLQPEVTVLDHNVGGAGGFCAGIARALADAAADHSQQTNHYVWLMDDDTIPTSTALEQLLAAAGEARERNGVWPAVLGSKALWTDGREHLMNKPRPRTWRALGAAKLQQSAEAFQVRSLSFVSCLINARMIESARALPRAAYFLWNDDYEYTTKLLRRATGYYVPASEVIHKTKVFGSSDADPGKRFFFEVRNKLWILRFSRSNFTAAEYAELLLKTLRRWVLTYWRSPDRAVILDCLKRGLREGLGQRPADNAELLDGNPEIVAAIGAVEISAVEG